MHTDACLKCQTNAEHLFMTTHSLRTNLNECHCMKQATLTWSHKESYYIMCDYLQEGHFLVFNNPNLHLL